MWEVRSQTRTCTCLLEFGFRFGFAFGLPLDAGNNEDKSQVRVNTRVIAALTIHTITVVSAIRAVSTRGGDSYITI